MAVMKVLVCLQVSLGMEKSGEDLEMDFPLDVATVPFRIPNSPAPELAYGEKKTFAPSHPPEIKIYIPDNS